MSMRNNLGKLIAAGITGIARPASARFHLIAGGGEYVIEASFCQTGFSSDSPLTWIKVGRVAEESKQPAG
jgi:hypothetical protein